MSYYIAPNSDLYVCKGVPLDTDYKNTLYWSTTSGGSSAGMASQEEYFISTMKYKYDKLSYQRVDKGKIRIEQCADDLYDCNYMMFRNTAFGDKWWYAFITGVEYINNVTSEISYEIDVMQTWFFSYELAYCFVEREHSDTDEIGDNIIPESLETGDYVTENYREIVLDNAVGGTRSITDGMFVVITSESSQIPDAGLIGNTPESLAYVAFNGDNNGSAGVLSAVRSAVSSGDIDKIVSIYVAPRCLCSATDITSSGVHLKDYNITPTTALVSTQTAITGDEYFDDYKPRNNKLYTYPYNYYGVDSGAGGSSLTLRYEYFLNNTPQFVFYGTALNPASITCVPTNYALSEKTENITPLYSKGITLKDYPECAYAGDLYKQWVAQNSVPNMLSIGSTIPAAAYNTVRGATKTVQAVTDTISQGYRASVGADLVRGQVSNGSAAYNSGVQAFYGGRYHIKGQFARIIDNYFTMYGYKTNRVKQPNRNCREKWNYVKTLDCTILPTSIPADDVARIEQIYDNGITFWHSPDYVGHYNLQNPIV